MKKYHSIKSKLLFWYVATIAILMAVFFIIFYISIKKSLNRNVITALSTFREELKDALIQNPVENWRYVVKKEISEEKEIFPIFVKILKIKNKEFKEIVAVTPDTLKIKHIPKFSKLSYNKIKDNSSIITEYNEYGIPFKILSFFLKNDINHYHLIQIGTPIIYVNETLKKFISIVLISVPILLLSFILGGFFLIKKTFAPVRNIVSTVKKISEKDLSKRIESFEKNNELSELINTFNNMLSRLESSFDQVKQFSNDVSHELKTPLTIIKGEIEVALRKNRPFEEYKELLKSVNSETDKLENIINNLLFLSKMDIENIRKTFKTVQFDEILLETYEEFETITQKKKITLILKKIQKTNLKGKRDLLKHLFRNLIDNAVKYTPKNGKVEIILEKRNNYAKFIISDSGIGIPKSSLSRIFDRFYRVDSARSNETGGTGLGLSIVKRVIDVHSGKIEVKSELHKGTTFIVSIPLKN